LSVGCAIAKTLFPHSQFCFAAKRPRNKACGLGRRTLAIGFAESPEGAEGDAQHAVQRRFAAADRDGFVSLSYLGAKAPSCIPMPLCGCGGSKTKSCRRIGDDPGSMAATPAGS
jgi:hypothetical protein